MAYKGPRPVQQEADPSATTLERVVTAVVNALQSPEFQLGPQAMVRFPMAGRFGRMPWGKKTAGDIHKEALELRTRIMPSKNDMVSSPAVVNRASEYRVVADPRHSTMDYIPSYSRELMRSPQGERLTQRLSGTGGLLDEELEAAQLMIRLLRGAF